MASFLWAQQVIIQQQSAYGLEPEYCLVNELGNRAANKVYGWTTQWADSSVVLLFPDTGEEFDVLEHIGRCAAVEMEWLLETNCAEQLEKYAVLCACWLLLHHCHGH